jgi:TonB family protein
MMRRFVLLSVAVHALVAGALYYLQPGKDATPDFGTLSVSLLKISEAASKSVQTPATENTGDTHTTPHQQTLQEHDSARSADPARTAQTGQPAVSKQTGKQPDNAKQTDITQTRNLEADMLDSLRSAVYSELQANFSYPRRARLRGWEGTVVITLRILPDGKLTDIRVAGSSGISTLDRAAVNSLRKVSVPQVVAWMDGKELAMTIPVEYRLTDG